MKKKYFLLGFLTGVVLSFVVLFIIVNSMNNSEVGIDIKYLEKPVNYENKKETSVKVFQVIGDAALAHESTDKDFNSIYGNTVLIMGENFYTDQIVVIKNPVRIGTYSYTTKAGIPKTVPVLKGNISE